MDKEECESIGGEWVKAYKKYDGTYVKSFCRRKDDKDDKKVIEKENKKYESFLIHKYLPDVEIKWVDWDTYDKLKNKEELYEPDKKIIYMINNNISERKNKEFRLTWEISMATSIAKYKGIEKYGKDYWYNPNNSSTTQKYEYEEQDKILNSMLKSKRKIY